MSHAIYTSFTNLIDSNGIPLPSARVFVFDAGTTNPRAVYSDAALAIPATNPVTVSQGGPHDMRYVAAGSYKIVVETGGNDTFGSGTVVAKYSKDNVDTGVAVGAGALPIASGGTSATTAAGARTALGVASSGEVADIATDVSVLQDTLTGTDATQLASGTTAQRPVTPVVGQVRENTTTTKFEGYIGAGWDNFMLEAGSASSTAAIAAETAEATFIRPDRIKYSPVAVQAWAAILWGSGAPVVNDNENVASASDGGTGDITITLATAMADANYAVTATAYMNSNTPRLCTVRARTTTTVRIIVMDTSASVADPDGIFIAVFGRHG